MRGLYYCRINKDKALNLGVIKKCESQSRAFHKAKIELDLLWHSDQGLLLNDQLIKKYRFHWLKHPVYTYFYYLFSEMPQIIRLIDFRNYDFLYIRFVPVHPYFLILLKRARKQNPGLKIFLEIPTYPYDDEFQGFLPRLALALDKILRKHLKRHIHRVIHYGQEEFIFEIPVITIRNGVDLEQIPVSNSKPIPNQLRMVAVGNWSYWHGLDRLLKGMGIYYQSYQPNEMQVQLTIIGQGKAYSNYRNLVQRYQLEPYVKFVPPLDDEQFNQYFEAFDLGIGTLGIHRIKVPFNSALKHREYCSRGLPFILSGPDKDFPTTLPFIHYLPTNDLPINVNEIIKTFKKLIYEKEDLHLFIRQYAEQHLSWEEQLKPVFMALKN